MKYRYRDTIITALAGDITDQETDGLVNAANSRLAGGGGVDGAIHARGGPSLMRELDSIRARQGGCPPGEAVITGGGNLAARYVIHTVGPVYRGRPADADLLAACYWSSLKLAHEYNLRSLAFPSVSTGTYRYPIAAAAPIAIAAVMNSLPSFPLAEVRFVLFSVRDLEIYQQLLAAEKALTPILPGRKEEKR
jgi:Predicted phosphatase homologous to the C-terminal domain of histone macroH2A1